MQERLWNFVKKNRLLWKLFEFFDLQNICSVNNVFHHCLFAAKFSIKFISFASSNCKESSFLLHGKI